MMVWLLLCGASLAFLLPLRHRPRFGGRLALCWAAALPVVPLQGLGPALPGVVLGTAAFALLWATVTARFCTEQEWTACCYCGIWLLPLTDLPYELWHLIRDILQEQGVTWPGTPAAEVVVYLAFVAVCYTAVYGTIARTMPEERVYHIGPRQLSSAVVLGGIFVFQFLTLQRVWSMPEAVSDQLIAPAFLTQLYCLTLLYLQTELFKKSAMQKEMDALNLLYDRQRQQYRVARQNVQIINKKCHELKVQIADLRRLAPDADTRRSLDEAEQAARLYDADIHTGNEVLDVALTEKSLLCESHGIRLNCVADGACLRFLEPGDLYALFANALDPAITAASHLAQRDRAMIDLLVCTRQGFAVINLVYPLDTAPESPKAGRYELKVVRRIGQKYGGNVTAETRQEFASLKVLLPLAENTPQ